MISALNAFQHGLTSEKPVLPTEGPLTTTTSFATG